MHRLQIMERIAQEPGVSIHERTGDDASFTMSTVLIGTSRIVAQLQDIFTDLPTDLLT